MNGPRHGFYSELARILNAGQSRSVLLTGNVHDLFRTSESADSYEPLIQFLLRKWDVPGLTLLVYELNGPIRILHPDRRQRLLRAWVGWRSGTPIDDLVLQALSDKEKHQKREMLEAEFERRVRDATGKPTLALEFLRQLTVCSRAETSAGKPYLDDNLLIIIEGADFLLPAGDGDISHLSPSDRRRVSIASDWFADPGFITGKDSVVLVSESRGLVHSRVSRLPQVLSVEVPAPDLEAREQYIESFLETSEEDAKPQLPDGAHELARFTAGLSIHALRQLLVGSAHLGTPLTPEDVIGKVEEFIVAQLGDGVVEFKKPSHTLDDVIGFHRLKEFIRTELLPRFRSKGPDALPGAAIAGPIGGGKTFLFEAVAAALDLPVLVLKNVRSQWFGQTDVIFERLRRVLEALDKVVIFVDEADTQFGRVSAGAHDTERRLTGKIQAMMSDPQLRGRVVWLLMTARIHLLSPDIRRPGRVGDLIIPVLDPSGEDRDAFVQWVVSAVRMEPLTERQLADLRELTRRYSTAGFASLRSELQARRQDGDDLPYEEIQAVIADHLPPALELTRRYQTLQALVNCTRRSLLPDPEISDEQRRAWQEELRVLESQGVQ